MTLPGFFDLQVNGYKGVDFTAVDLSEEEVIFACRELFSAGTAAFLPTITTSPIPVYRRNLALLAKVIQRPEFRGRLPGIHLEGPFISRLPGAVGAHNPDEVKEPDVDLLREMLGWAEGRVKLLTLAAELPGADDLAHYATQQGITVSIGHSLADEAQLDFLVRSGARAITHLGNGLPNLIHRHHNFIWAGLANDDLIAMLIADGHHLPAAVLKTFFRAKGVAKIIIVSDAAPVAGLKPGRYTTLSNDAILEENGLFHNPVKQCLVGSSATLLQCINHLAGLGFASEEDLIRVGFTNPLRLMGLEPDSIPATPGLYFNPAASRFEIVQ
jgi:N-acetylglucosamine-6-phosphate deacetylase